MLKNPSYVYGGELNSLPTHLNFGQLMVETLWKYGDNIALINGETHEKLTYREMVTDAMNIAISLKGMGVKRGDVVAVCSENRQAYWSTLIGILCTGAAVTPTNTMYTKDELKHVLNISKPKMIFCSPFAYKNHDKTLRDLPFIKKIILFGKDKYDNSITYDEMAKGNRDLSGDNFIACDVIGQIDTAIILYSSGTTGLPKGVMLTHVNVLTTCFLPSTMDPKEISLTISPWYHTMGLMACLRTFLTRNPTVYLPRFDSDLYLKTIEKYRIYQIAVAPPVLVAISMAKNNYDVSSLKISYSGAAPLREDTIKSVKERFPSLKYVLQGYGMTESTLAILRDTYATAPMAKPGSVGRVVAGTIVKVVDTETGKPLGPNQSGEIRVKGSIIMKGYIGKDKSEDFDDEGFLKTGDIGYYDDDKYFYIVDRLKELIKYKGYQVPPAEIEGVLLQHPNIRDAGVIGVPHEEGGEIPRAFVVLQPGCHLTEQDVIDFIAGKLSNPKHLRGGVKFIDEIPKNPSGKILRKILREMTKTMYKSKL